MVVVVYYCVYVYYVVDGDGGCVVGEYIYVVGG